MADGSIVFETSLDSEGLQTSLDESLKKIKAFGDAGAKALGKLSGIKVDGYEKLNTLLGNMTEHARELAQYFKDIAASTPKDTTQKKKTTDNSEQTKKETEAIVQKEEAVKNLEGAQTKQVKTEQTLKGKTDEAYLKSVKEYSDKAQQVNALEVAEMKLANAERKLKTIADTRGEDSLEFKEQALAVQKQKKAIEDLIIARDKLNAKQLATPKSTNTADKAAAKEAEAAARAAEKAMADDTARKTRIAEAAFKGLNSAVGTTLNLFKKLGSAALSALSKVTVKPLINSFKTLGKVAYNAISKGIALPFKMMAKPLENLSTRWDHFKKLLTKVTIYKGFRMLMQQIVKSIKEGVEALYRWGQAQNSGIGSNFVKNLDKIVTSLAYLKNTVSAVLTPIVNYFAPLIDAWIDKLVSKINIVSATIANAFGEKTFVKAVKIPHTYAEQLDKASKKSKELKRSLMSFDKLNRLDGDKNSDDEPDYSKYFDVANVAEEKLLTLKGVMDKFLNSDIKAFGSKLGKQLQKITKTVNKFFKNTNFQKIGKQFAEFFNGLLEAFDGKELGKLLGNTIKAIVDMITGFARKINATKLGEAIANIFIGIVEVLEEIDIADTINTVFTAILDAFDGFINKLFEVDEEGNNIFVRIANMISTGINSLVDTIRNSDTITDDISKVVLGLFELISTTIENIDWQAMAATGLRVINALIKSLANIIKQIDTKKMADSINSVVHTLLADGSLLSNILSLMQNLFEGATSLLIEIFNTSGTEIAQTIADGINRIFTYLGTEDAQESLRALFESLTNVMVTLITKIDWSVVGTTIIKSIGSAIEGVGDASPIALAIGKILAGLFIGGKLLGIVSGAMKGLTGKGLLATIIEKLTAGGAAGGGLAGAIANIKAFFSLAFEKGLGGALQTLSSGTGVLAIISGAITAISSFISMLKNGFSWFKEILMVIGVALAAVGAVILGAPAAVAAVIAAIVAAVGTAVVLIKEHWEEIKEGISKAWEWIKEKASALWEGIKTFFSDTWEGVKDAVKFIWDIIKNGFKAIGSFIWGSLKNAWNTLKNLGKTLFNGIKDILSGIIRQFKGWVTLLKGIFTGDIKTIFEGFKDIVGGVLDTVKGMFKTAINFVIDIIEHGINGAIIAINKILDPLRALKTNYNIGFNIPEIKEVKLPRLATGTVVPANFGQFAAILGDNKTEPEVVSPLSTMKQAFKEALTEMGGFQIDASDVYIDGQRVGKIVFDVHNATVTRTGRTPLKGV